VSWLGLSSSKPSIDALDGLLSTGNLSLALHHDVANYACGYTRL
jgi:hypothetical protein